MANPRKPASVLLMQKSSKAQRLLARINELDVPPGEVGEAPEWFTPEALAAWDRIKATPEYVRVLNPLHRPALVALCHLIGKDERQMSGHPDAEKLNTMEIQRLTNLTMQFGFTPVSSAKVNLPSKKESASTFGEFKSA